MRIRRAGPLTLTLTLDGANPTLPRATPLRHFRYKLRILHEAAPHSSTNRRPTPHSGDRAFLMLRACACVLLFALRVRVRVRVLARVRVRLSVHVAGQVRVLRVAEVTGRSLLCPNVARGGYSASGARPSAVPPRAMCSSVAAS